jgi:hypothetical protein
MKQYCRYCANALDYNGEGTEFLCNADAPCGNNGAGRFYDAEKAKRKNKCKYFHYFLSFGASWYDIRSTKDKRTRLWNTKRIN